MKHFDSKDDKKKQERERLIINIHLAYLSLAHALIEKAKETLASISTANTAVATSKAVNNTRTMCGILI